MFILLPIVINVILAVILVYSIFSNIRRKKDCDLQLGQMNQTLQSSRRIYQLILENLDFEIVVQKIADTIPHELQFGTGVVAMIDEQKRTLKRVAASKTPEAQSAIKMLTVPFEKIEVSLDDQNNLMSRSLRERKPFISGNLYDVLGPVVSADEAKKVQEVMGTKTTLVYPIFLKEKPLGVFIASTKKEQSQLTSYELFIINDFVNIVGLVMQNSQLYTSLKIATNDLTRVNAEVSRINAQLQQLDKLKDDFVSIASHELRTPMTAIRSYVWMAINRSDIPLSDKLKKYLSRTLISTERLINLVNDMLNISRIESGRIAMKPVPFDLDTLIKDVMYEVEAKAKDRNVSLSVNNSEVPSVFADADKVHQILLNLIGNSLKFTNSGGKIVISFSSDGNFVKISITDSGVGIAGEDLSRLFTKFGRLDNSYVAAATSGGTGLGLYICKNLTELMGGRISATSEGLGRGTTFSFTLPVSTPQLIANASKLNFIPVGEVKTLEPVAL